VLEKGREVLTKVAISGGGRCNVTHACFEPRELAERYPRGARELLGPFTRFGPTETAAWFQAHGVALKTEADGRMFPTTDRSTTVVQALRRAAERAGVTVRTRAEVRAIAAAPGGGFRVSLRGGGAVECERILLAPGGQRRPEGYELAAALGQAIVPPVPSLFTFRIADPRLRELAGVTVERVAISIAGTALRHVGALLVTHTGLSGPAVLGLSAWGARELHARGHRFEVTVAWREDLTDENAAALVADQIDRHPRRRVHGHAPLPLPRRLWTALAAGADVLPERTYATLTRNERRRLVFDLARTKFAVAGVSPHKEEFVTCGGVALPEVDFRTMASRIVPGLFFAGEYLDIDGLTGGYNLQAAWTTGWIAGAGLAGGSG
jgi:hypothetical protein